VKTLPLAAFCPVLAHWDAHVKIGGVIRRLAALCAATACCFAVASCSSSGKPSAESSGGASVPSYASSNDQHGAEQFAGYWVDTLNKATVSGKTAQLKALSDKSCTRCSDFAAKLDEIYAGGGHVETSGWDVETMVPERGLPQGTAGMKVQVKVAPQSVYETAQSKAQKVKGGQLTFRLVLTRNGDHWLVKSLDV
jgi:hypothetical protein